MESLRTKSDLVGSAASTLCVVHCIATPFLFVATATATGHFQGPAWWSAIDYIFIAITFLAVHTSSRSTSKQWMSYALYTSWIVLTALILNEKTGLAPIPDVLKYLSAITLIGLHLYNRKYCQCESEHCATA